MNPSNLAIVVKECIKENQVLMIKGAPGVGKSRLIEQIITQIGYKGLYLDTAIMGQTDLKGIPMYHQESDSASFKPYDVLLEMINATEPTLVVFDDFGLATPSVQGSVMHLLSERRVGNHKISDKVVFILATNEQKQHAGVGMVLEPIKSRCHSIIGFEPDVENWLNWGYKNNIHPHVLGFIRFRPEMLWQFDATNDLTNSPSPRTNHHVSDIINLKLPMDIEYEMVEGAAGSAYAIEFTGYRKMAKNLVSLDYIIENPSVAEVPEEPSVLYATTTALAYRAKKENIEALLTYAKRMPEEFALNFVEYNIMAKDASLKETAAYGKWIIEYQHLLKN